MNGRSPWTWQSDLTLVPSHRRRVATKAAQGLPSGADRPAHRDVAVYALWAAVGAVLDEKNRKCGNHAYAYNASARMYAGAHVGKGAYNLTSFLGIYD
jgi:hypothetical protein